MIKLSITGADNNVDIQELSLLSKSYPMLELAVLYLPEKENQARNPGKTWRNNFLKAIPKENTALHLCGGTVFKQILESDFEDSELFNELKQYSRLQLNINARKDLFVYPEVLLVYEKLLKNGFHLILQYHERSQNVILKSLDLFSDYKHNIDILLDASLGKGVTPETFEIPAQLQGLGFKIGFAGGLNPENIGDVHDSVKKLKVANYWLDLESGVRINNEFSMEKALALCKAMFK